ncbi:hypothetical protein ROS1_54770 [Roseibium sp. ROS1]
MYIVASGKAVVRQQVDDFFSTACSEARKNKHNTHYGSFLAAGLVKPFDVGCLLVSECAMWPRPPATIT